MPESESGVPRLVALESSAQGFFEQRQPQGTVRSEEALGCEAAAVAFGGLVTALNGGARSSSEIGEYLEVLARDGSDATVGYVLGLAETGDCRLAESVAIAAIYLDSSKAFAVAQLACRLAAKCPPAAMLFAEAASQSNESRVLVVLLELVADGSLPIALRRSVARRVSRAANEDLIDSVLALARSGAAEGDFVEGSLLLRGLLENESLDDSVRAVVEQQALVWLRSDSEVGRRAGRGLIDLLEVPQ